MSCKGLPEGMDPRLVFDLCRRIIAERAKLYFTDVARAICIAAYLQRNGLVDDRVTYGPQLADGVEPNASKEIKLCELYGVLLCSKQNVNHWVRRDLKGWYQHWSEQLDAGLVHPDAPVKRRRRVSADDWCWILGSMERGRIPFKSFEKHAQRIRVEALKDPQRQHLAGISHQILRRRGWSDDELIKYGIDRQSRRIRKMGTLGRN